MEEQNRQLEEIKPDEQVKAEQVEGLVQPNENENLQSFSENIQIETQLEMQTGSDAEPQIETSIEPKMVTEIEPQIENQTEQIPNLENQMLTELNHQIEIDIKQPEKNDNIQISATEETSIPINPDEVNKIISENELIVEQDIVNNNQGTISKNETEHIDKEETDLISGTTLTDEQRETESIEPIHQEDEIKSSENEQKEIEKSQNEDLNENQDQRFQGHNQIETLDKSIKEEVESELDTSEHNPIADVIAAVEQSITTSTVTNTTKPSKSATKKKAKIQTPKIISSVASINNSITSTINEIANGVLTNTSPQLAQKRRKKDPFAPKAPLNGYLVYFNEERADMRQKNPNIGFGELTKIIAAKWKELSAEEKQKYINEAELDKERYVKEMADYKKSDAYRQYLKENANSKLSKTSEEQTLNESLSKNNQNGNFQQQIQQQNQYGDQPNLSWLQSESNIAGFDVPIFTEEFIEHSKSREQELRQLRKEINELEQQNSVLNKHVDNLKQSTQKIDCDIEQFKSLNSQMQKNTDIFRQTVLHCFNNTPLPNTQDYVPTSSNIDDYIMMLLQIVNMHNQIEQQQNLNDQNYMMNRNFVVHVKSVFSKINFNSLFDSV